MDESCREGRGGARSEHANGFTGLDLKELQVPVSCSLEERFQKHDRLQRGLQGGWMDQKQLTKSGD